MSDLLYLAYGSNLHPARLAARIPDAEFVSVARLEHHRISFAKIGSDTSGKCTIHAGAEATVHGAVYRVSGRCRARLDRIEGGYRPVELDTDVAGRTRTVFTYIARKSLTRESMLPFDWYRALVVAGARYHDFPATYIEALKAVETVPDPDLARRLRNAELLARLERLRAR